MNDNKDERIIDQNVPFDQKGAEFIVNNLMVEETKNEFVSKKRDEENERMEVSIENSLFTKDDEKYFSAFLGENADKITKSKYNVSALLLGGIYLIYRKNYIVGTLWLLLNTVFLTFAPACNVNIFIIIGFMLVSQVLCGYFANSIIMNNVGVHILTLKNKFDGEDIRKECREQGGVNLKVALILFTIYALVYGAVLMGFGYKYYKKYIYKPAENNNNVITHSFDGTFISDTNIVLEDVLSIAVPEEFKESDKMGKHTLYYVYGDVDNYLPKASIEVSVIMNHTDPRPFIEAITDYKLELRDNIKTYATNDFTWYYINTAEGSKNTIYASALINGRLVLVEYMYYYNLEDTFLPYFETILDSIY